MQASCTWCWLVWIFAALALTFAFLRARRHWQRETRELSGQLESARHAHALLRAVLDASPLAVILCAESGRIVLENEAARRLFFLGQSAEGQNFLRLVANGPEQLQPALLHANDEIVPLIVEGRPQSYHFARRRLEHAGEPHSLLIVRPMTREVARRDLDVLKQVVRVLSHEVNNSLAPVSSLVHSARLIASTGERIERLGMVFDTIEERSRHLSSFVAGYASLARLPKPAPRSVSWRSLFERLAMLYPQAQLRAPAGVEGFIDPAQIEQALINLLKNANEAGGEPSAVQLEVRSGDGGASELCALDRGRGFSAEALEQALLPFFTTKAGGHGIGLALAREVVEAHGGELSIANRPDGGAQVRMWLPGPRAGAAVDTRVRLTLTSA